MRREVVRYDCSPTVSKSHMHDLVQTRLVANIIAKEVPPNSWFIVPVTEAVRKIVDRAVKKYHFRDIEEGCRTTASIHIFYEHQLPQGTRLSNMSCNPKLQERKHGNCRRHWRSSCANSRANAILMVRQAVSHTKSKSCSSWERRCSRKLFDMSYHKSLHLPK